MTSRRLSPPAATTWFALGLAAAGGFLVAQDQPTLPREKTWPPYPAEDIINLTGVEKFSKRSRDRTIFTVPSDRWFVVTDFRRELVLESDLDPDLDLCMLPDKSKREIVVIPHQMSDSVNFGPIGVKFPPKSKVVLHRNAELSGDLTSTYMLTGYLVEVEPEER